MMTAKRTSSVIAILRALGSLTPRVCQAERAAAERSPAQLRPQRSVTAVELHETVDELVDISSVLADADPELAVPCLRRSWDHAHMPAGRESHGRSRRSIACTQFCFAVATQPARRPR